MDAQPNADQARDDQKQQRSRDKALTWPLKREARRLGPVHEYWQLPACVKVCLLSWWCVRSLRDYLSCWSVAWCTSTSSCQPVCEDPALPILAARSQ